VGRIEPKIARTGGEQLAAFMCEHNVGVARSSVYDVEKSTPPSSTRIETLTELGPSDAAPRGSRRLTGARQASKVTPGARNRGSEWS
jgi:hypothetical protein